MPDRTVAVLIGVRDYPAFGGLDSPYQDVAVVRETLRDIGVRRIVERAQNVRGPKSRAVIVGAIEEARSALADLPQSEDGEDITVLFYFAGHGLSIDGRNYLLTDDFDPGDRVQLSINALDLEHDIVSKLGFRSDIQSVVLIDACRTESDRLRGSAAFVQPGFIPGKTLLSFAAGPGQSAGDGGVEGHSPFSKALRHFLPVRCSIQDCLAAVSGAVFKDTWGAQRPVTVDYGVNLWLAGRPEPSVPQTPAPSAPIRPTPRQTYTDAEVSARRHLVRDFPADETAGRRAYYFVLVEKEFASDFDAALRRGGGLTLEDYGVVLASSYGDTPSREVVEYLNRRYGWDIAVPRETLAPAGPTPPASAMMVALRQHTGFGAWRHLVLLVGPENRAAFAQAADQLAAMDRGGLGADGRGVLGAIRRLTDGATASLFNIDQLAHFGMVVYRGDGPTIPARVQENLRRHYGVVFDWSDWETMNGAIAELLSARPG